MSEIYRNSPMRYEVQKGDKTPFKLVSVVDTEFGGSAINFICGGTYNYCMSIKTVMECK